MEFSTSIGRGGTEYPRCVKTVHWSLCSVVSPVTCRAGSQNTLLLALPSVPPPLWECRQSGLASLRQCVHKAPEQICQQRSTAVRYEDCCGCAPGCTIGVWKQSILGSSLHMHVPTKPIAAKASPIPAMGVPAVHLDVM